MTKASDINAPPPAAPESPPAPQGAGKPGIARRRGPSAPAKGRPPATGPGTIISADN